MFAPVPQAALESHGRDRRLERAARAERVPVQPLRAGDWNARGVVAQGQMESFRLCELVELGARGMGVDVANLLRLEPRAGQCAANRQGGGLT